MYRIYFTNHEYYSDLTFSSMCDVFEYIHAKGFDCRIEDDKGNLIGVWDGISGYRSYLNQSL